MKKLIILKTQLAEAAKFARSKRHAHKRIAVILLDNFIEIQLSAMMKNVFRVDGYWNRSIKKYTPHERKKIQKYHQELLTACVKENIISVEDKVIISFCHDIRNNLYHQGDEDTLLTKVALIFIHEIVLRYQLGWKNGQLGFILRKDDIDPYASKGTSPINANSDKEWRYFLKKYINWIDKEEKSPQQMLSEYLLNKLNESQEWFNYIESEHGNHFLSMQGWEFNDYLVHYSFYILEKEKIELLQSITNSEEKANAFKNLYKAYQKNWKPIKKPRIEILARESYRLTNLSQARCIEKYLDLRQEVLLINTTLKSAVEVIDQLVEEQIERSRLK